MRRAALILAAALIAVWFCAPILPKGADEVSPILRGSDGGALHVATTQDGYYRLPVDLNAVDPAFIRALIAMEDQRFLSHAGVDMLAIVRAVKSNASAGRVVSGASTITQQLGRQYKPRSRTYMSKVIEAAEALRLNARLTKREQLERYLTRISYGGNIQGVEAAAQIWLGKSARYLSVDEIALLLALPQAPEARRPDRNPVAAKAGRDLILDRLVEAALIDPAEAKAAKSQPVTTQKHALPEGHFLALQALGGGTATLDGTLQSQVQAQLRRHVETLPKAVNAAALIVHAPTREVRALVGAGAVDHAGGWIDMTDRLRSPGSTLKPFIYGLARDDGLLDFGTDVRDAPTRFGSYRPENFTRAYHGRVSIAEALQHSLNVPAVTALNLVGADRFRAVLAAAGPQTRGRVGDDQGEGLALALGGTGLSARDLAVLYTALANGGQAGPLRYRAGGDDGDAPPYALMTPDTAAETLRVLRGAPRPKGFTNMAGTERIAYKTGTSYGYRDSWAAGIAGDYVLIVWIGRPDGAPRAGRTGRGSAAPLLFDIAVPLMPEGRSFTARVDTGTPSGLQAINRETDRAPQILFPADGSDVVSSIGDGGRGLSISVESDETVAVYVSGEAVTLEAGLSVWHPPAPGFYTVTAVDEQGRSAQSTVRILARDQFADAPF